MLEARNSTSYTCDPDMAQSVLGDLPRYLAAMQALADDLPGRLTGPF